MTGVSRNKWLWLFGTGLLLSGAVGIIIAGYVGLLAYSAVASGAPVFPVLLDIALPVLESLAVVVALLALSGVGLLWVIVRSASLPRSEPSGSIRPSEPSGWRTSSRRRSRRPTSRPSRHSLN